MVIPYDNLRYSLDPRLSPDKYFERRGIEFKKKLNSLDGAQDIYLTGNPQITFFKVVYRRYTSFSMESIEQTFNGSADWGKKVTSTISRNGDLIHKTYLQVELPSVTVPAGDNAFRWLNWLGHILVKTVELEIGGQRIDKHYSAWLHIWNELTQTPGHAAGYANMVGNVPELTSVAVGGETVPSKTLYIPLQFFYCRNPGLKCMGLKSTVPIPICA